MEKAEQGEQWKQAAAEEEETEEEVAAMALQGRRPRSLAAAASIPVGDVSGDAMLLPSEPVNGFREQDELQESNGNSNDVEIGPQERSEKNVYYDNDEGTESINGFSVKESGGVQGSDSEKNHGDEGLTVTTSIFHKQKSESTVITRQYKENGKDTGFSAFRLLSSEESSKDLKANKSFSDISVAHDDIELIKEIDQELTEIDVERVLEKQDTHDLYCPNCNSCITRRVILRKRKRKIRDADEEAKRNKLVTVVVSELSAISAHATGDQDHNAVDISLNGNLIPATDEYNRGRDTEVFRCLSCFSFFIPTDNGFKLFKIFGGKRDKENSQSPQTTSTKKKNWLSSIFGSRTEEISIGQEGTLMSHHELDTVHQLDSSGSWDEMHSNNESKQQTAQFAGIAPVHSEEHAEKSVFKPQPNGLKILVHSSEQSGTVENSQMEQKLNVAIERKSADDIISTPFLTKPVAVREAPENNEEINIVADLPSEYGKNVGDTLLNRSVAEDKNVTVNIIDATYSSGASQYATVGTKVDIHIEESLKANRDAFSLYVRDASLFQDRQVNTTKGLLNGLPAKTTAASDTIITVKGAPDEPAASQEAQNIVTSAGTGPSRWTGSSEARGFHGLEIIKSMVYGGLVESITSLGIVSSAAGADAATLNIMALGLANLIGGLFVIGHNLWELKDDRSESVMTNRLTEGVSNQLATVQRDRYQELLGRRENLLLHATFAVLSFVIFGLLPPVVYGFSFRESDNRDFKLIAVAIASLLCIVILATGKVYVQRPPKSYIKTIMYYVVMGFSASAVSYALGDLVSKLLEKLGWFNSGFALTLPVPVPETRAARRAWGSY